jgi:hypothetical protein
MRESRPYGSVRGALSNERPYRNPENSRRTPGKLLADEAEALSVYIECR